MTPSWVKRKWEGKHFEYELVLLRDGDFYYKCTFTRCFVDTGCVEPVGGVPARIAFQNCVLDGTNVPHSAGPGEWGCEM